MNIIKGFKKKKKIKISKIILLIFSIIILYWIIDLYSNKLKSDEITENNISKEACIEKASKNIVGITRNYNIIENSMVSWGSGVVISKDGYILTNEHVSGPQKSTCYIVLSSSERYKGNIIWSDSELDLAIVKIDYKFEDCAILGDSNELKLGEDVFSIGNPINIDFEKCVNYGVISGLNRNLEFEENGQKFYLNDLIQTDAIINPGNSGGALINDVGQVIGITTIKISSADAMGFAIPINIIKPILNKLENEGNFKQATLGIWGYDKYSIQKINNGIKLKKGIYVGQVGLNSISEKAGIKVGDIIISINGKDLEKISDLRFNIFEKNPGDTVFVKIVRDNSEFNVQMKLDER